MVSIIIPNYNHELFLKQRIDSVLKQSYQNFEIIILDDNSTDGSRDVIEKYRTNAKVSNIIYNENNSGSVFKQWIKGIDLAKGDYIWIAESDDFATDNFLETTVQLLDKNLELGMVFTNTQMVDELGSPIEDDNSKSDVFRELKEQNNTIDKTNLTSFLFKHLIIKNASSVLFRKKALKSIRLQDITNFTNTGDRFVYIGIAISNKIIYIEDRLNFMRSHQNNTTKKNFTNGKIYKDRLKIFSYYIEKLDLNSGAKDNLLKYFNYNFVWFVEFCSYDEVKSIIKILRKKNVLNLSVILYRSYHFFFKKISPYHPDKVKGYVESYLYKL